MLRRSLILPENTEEGGMLLSEVATVTFQLDQKEPNITGGRGGGGTVKAKTGRRRAPGLLLSCA